MKTIIHFLILILLFSCAGSEQTLKNNNNNTEFEIPRLALKLLADSLSDPCSICQKKLRKQAYKILTEELYPKKIIITSEGFVKTNECSSNEFVLSNYKTREEYLSPQNTKEKFPLLVFKLHTNSNHLVGISKADYTEQNILTKFITFPNNTHFNAELETVNYAYSDAPCCNFILDENKLVVHCKIQKISVK